MEHALLYVQRRIIQLVDFVWLVRLTVATAVLQDVLCVIPLTSNISDPVTQVVPVEPSPTDSTAILTPACTTAAITPMDVCRV